MRTKHYKPKRRLASTVPCIRCASLSQLHKGKYGFFYKCGSCFSVFSTTASKKINKLLSVEKKKEIEKKKELYKELERQEAQINLARIKAKGWDK